MTTSLEEQLNEALTQRAASLPPLATERLRSIDYHPRRHLLVVPIAVGTGAAASAATAGTVLALVLGGSAPAYAGWSATPTSSTATPSPQAPLDCQSQLSNLPSGRSSTNSSSGTWQTLLTDVRGPFTIALLQNGASYAACFTGPSFIAVNQITPAPNGSGANQSSGSLSVSSAGGSGRAPGPATGGASTTVLGTSSGDADQVVQNHLTTTSDGPYTMIDGRVANGVTGVALVLNDGQDVTATVADGWFVAWWPRAAGATSVQVTKASGTTSEPLVTGIPAATPATPGSCASDGANVNCSSSGARKGVSGDSGNSGAAAAIPGSCTQASVPTGSGGPSVNCSSPGSGNSGGTGPGPTTDSNP
jgi:hypothetical protein